MAKTAPEKRILIVEDEKPVARVLQIKLSQKGYDTEVAPDGLVALEDMKDDGFKLILLDLMMPHLDGFGVLEGMKKMKYHAPVVVLTNLSQPEDEERVLALGAKAYYVKANTPLTVVVGKIQHLLGDV